MKRVINGALSLFGYELRKRPGKTTLPAPTGWFSGKRLDPVDELDPIWPLPRRNPAMTDESIREQFELHEHWHYAFEFEGGLSFATRHRVPDALKANERRPLQRFRHFMPYVVHSQGDSLKGKRVLDIACNSGFWSIQCALLGADVVGFDARPELIREAELVKSIVGVNNARFEVRDFWDMTPDALGGTFDVVLNLGLLYHLPDPLAVLAHTKAMSHGTMLLDTTVDLSAQPLISLLWEEARDVSATACGGIAAFPTKSAISLMLKHLVFRDWTEIPVRHRDMPDDFLQGRRAAWLAVC
jgi:2-polyprenyl-3-methyl-5-hydroxy-6-metoxy-1,4-benzoquinol methylase